jgi:hypothetical protein
MSYNGSGTFQINTSGQPVVAGTVISSTAFNALTADLATGLSTAITKDGQTTTTARIPFAAGINSSLVTDSTNSTSGSIITAGGVGVAKAVFIGTTLNVAGASTMTGAIAVDSVTDSTSTTTGSIQTDGGVGIAKALYVGTTANVAGAATLSSTLTYGGVTLTNAVTGTGKMVLDTSPTISGLTASGANLSLPVIDNIKLGYTTTATAAGTTTLTAASNYQQFFTGTLAQTIVLPVTSTLALGMGYHIENNSTGTLTVQSSGANTITTIPAGVTTQFTCILITGTTAASWDYDHIGFSAITGTGSAVLATSPTITTPTISSLSSAAATALTLQSAGATAITVDTSQNVGIGNSTPSSFDTTGKPLVVGSGSGNQGITIYAGTTGYSTVNFADGTTGTDRYSGQISYDHTNNALVFATTTGLERMRIDSSGQVGIGMTAVSSVRLAVAAGSSFIMVGRDSTGATDQIRIAANGNVTNTNNSYAGISDIKLKENIVDATPKLSSLMQVRVVNYNLKANSGYEQNKQIGVVAQELESIFPSLIEETIDRDVDGNDLGTSTKSVKYSVFVPMLIKAIQEQQVLITALTTRITALENK